MGFRGDTKTEMSVTRREAGNPQYPKRVLHKARGDVSQDLGFKVGPASIRVDDYAIAIFGHGIDRDVPTRQILFEGHRGVGVHRKAVIAVTALALGAGQRIFLLGLGMQKHREILAHLGITLGE